jgi:hypothetical protein
VSSSPGSDDETSISSQPKNRLPAFLRAGQAFDDDRRAAGLGPDREELREIGAARDVRIEVHADIDTVSARRLDQLERARHHPPVAPTGDRQVRDLEATAARPRDVERLAHGVEQVVAVVAHVDREQPVVTRDRSPDRHELVAVCRHRGRVHQPGRHARRAVVEAGVDGGDERTAFGIVEGSCRLPGDRDPQRHMTNQGSRVDRQAGVME